MTTDTSESGLEALIVKQMTSAEGGWLQGSPQAYDREYGIDLQQFAAFLHTTQEESASAVSIDDDGPTRRAFLARLQGEITKRGVISVLRDGIKHGAHSVEVFYGSPSEGNPKAAEQYKANRFTVTRQLRYSRDETRLALDLCIFINGLPVATFELKNNLTKQTVEDAVEQYKRDRDPRELIFQFGRCLAHFAVDDQEVRFCTHLQAKQSWFLPFDRGWNFGAGNPPNPDGLKTDYLWRRILTPTGLTEILENYAQLVIEKDPRTGKKRSSQIFPRYHQLEVVRLLLADAKAHGVGRRYLIQHSAGSGKSNSIAWLAHQLIGIKHDGKDAFDSIIVVTDRVILDRQIRDTIKQFAQVGATVGHAERSGQLKGFIADGKKIIITTVQKFPFILEDIGTEHRQRHFAILIDEAHSSQGGRTSAAMATALAEGGASDQDETVEDKINRLMTSKKMLPNASYFAFTATPKNKTLEIFGDAFPDGGVTKHRPFHSYTMKQAIEEGFILDVLKSYTPVNSYYRLVKTVESDPEFDVTDTIQSAFSDYYRTTILSEETDPNKLHDIQAVLDGYEVYDQSQIVSLVELYLGNADRDKLDPILDACVATYKEDLDEDGQVDFKGKAKAFVRTYGFLSSILPYTNAGWERLSIFLNFLIPKLPAPKEEDLSRGLLETIDMDSYRVEKQAAIKIALADEDAEIVPVPASGGGHLPEPELDHLSNILKTFNEQFGNIDWQDADRVNRLITVDIPTRVAADRAYQNAQKNNDKQNARIEHDKALARVMTSLIKDDTQLFKQFSDNESFKRWLTDTVFDQTYDKTGT